MGPVRIPRVVGALIAVTFVLSVLSAILGRNGVPGGLARWGVLLPEAVFHGQVWRLATWQFFEFDPIGLLFACLMLYWFGRDLCDRWGPARFLGIYFGFSAVVGLLVCVIGRFLWSDVYQGVYAGTWPVAEAMTIAWALAYPDREIYLFFLVRAGGKILIALTIGLTLLWAAFVGLPAMLPHFLAELLMLVYMGELRRFYLRWKLGRLQAQKKRYVDNVIRVDFEEQRKGPPDGKPPRWLN